MALKCRISIPAKKRKLFRKYEGALFFAIDQFTREERLYAFYLLLLPLLQWLKKDLAEYNLEPEELDSELFLLAERIFSRFDKDKTSIVPYLRTWIPIFIKEMKHKLKKNYGELIVEAPLSDEYHYIDEEFYWNDIIFQDTWAGKCFTRGEKYFIYVILTSDNNKLSQRSLAETTNMGRQTVNNMLQDLKEVLQLEEPNERKL